METNKKLVFYFAHNFNDRKEMREIELKLEKELDIELFNPFYDDATRVEEMKELDSIKASSRMRMASFDGSSLKHLEKAGLIVKKDLVHLAGCDGLFTIVKTPSFGTAIEICNAVLMRKIVYFVSETYFNHPWIKVYATKVFKDLADFKTFMLKIQ